MRPDGPCRAAQCVGRPASRQSEPASIGSAMAVSAAAPLCTHTIVPYHAWPWPAVGRRRRTQHREACRNVDPPGARRLPARMWCNRSACDLKPARRACRHALPGRRRLRRAGAGPRTLQLRGEPPASAGGGGAYVLIDCSHIYYMLHLQAGLLPDLQEYNGAANSRQYGLVIYSYGSNGRSRTCHGAVRDCRFCSKQVPRSVAVTSQSVYSE